MEDSHGLTMSNQLKCGLMGILYGILWDMNLDMFDPDPTSLNDDLSWGNYP